MDQLMGQAFVVLLLRGFFTFGGIINVLLGLFVGRSIKKSLSKNNEKKEIPLWIIFPVLLYLYMLFLAIYTHHSIVDIAILATFFIISFGLVSVISFFLTR